MAATRAEQPRRIGLIGVHPSRSCSASGFVRDLRNALFTLAGDIDCFSVLAHDIMTSKAAPSVGALHLMPEDPHSWRRALNYLNFSDVDVVSLHHDFDSFGGAAGTRLCDLIDGLDAPMIATLHQVPTHPEGDERAQLREIAGRAARVVVMARKGAEILQDTFGVASAKIEVIPYGIHRRSALPAHGAKAALGVGGRTVLMTVGLLSPEKGVEMMIEALPAIVAERPDVVYLVIGETHPDLQAREGERYRDSLIELARARGIDAHIVFVPRHVQPSELPDVLAAADIYVSPYLSEAAFASHTLASAFGCGRAVVATPFWQAQELLADERGALVPFGNPDALAATIGSLLGDNKRLNIIRRRALAAGRAMLWPEVARRYRQLFAQAMDGKPIPTRVTGAKGLALLPVADEPLLAG